MSQLFTSEGQIIGASFPASVFPVNIQDWFSAGLTDLISLLSKGFSRVFSSTSLKTLILWCSAFFMVQLPHPYMTTGKTRALTIQTFVSKVMSLLLLSRYVIAFLPRSKCLNFMADNINSDFGASQNKVSHCFHCFPSICYEVMGPVAKILVFWALSQLFHFLLLHMVPKYLWFLLEPKAQVWLLPWFILTLG